MDKVTKVKNHLSNDELEKKIKETVGFWRVQKWLIPNPKKLGNLN